MVGIPYLSFPLKDNGIIILENVLTDELCDDFAEDLCALSLIIVSLYIHENPERIELVKNHFDLRPAAIIEQFNLRNLWF